MLAPRRKWLEVGFFLVVVGVPLVFLPLSRGPFAEPKLLLVEVGALALWAARPAADRGLARAAALWVGALAVAGALGVDRWWSLAGPENLLSGVVLLAASAFLLVAGSGVPAGFAPRLARWVVGAGTAVALVGIAFRVWPGVFDRFVPDLAFGGGTLGHPVFLSGITAVGIVAALGLRNARPAWVAAAVVVLASGLAVSTKRAGWVALVAGLLVAIPKGRVGRSRALLVAGTAAATLAAWTAAGAFLDLGAPVSGAARFGELGTDSARSRIVITRVLARAVGDRPILGWGPGNTWSAYVANATPEDVALADRGVGDAHDFLLESATTTGVVGLVLFLLLAARAAGRARRAPPEVGWAAGAAAALAAFHLLQPVNVALTPMLFLLAGVAGGPAASAGATAVAPGTDPPFRPARAVVGALLAAGVAVSALLLAASVLEQYGRTYAEEWALRASLRLAPGRVSAAEALAIHLAVDGRSGNEAAARQATHLAADTVARHPWNPGVRLVAVDVHLLLRDPEGAREWLRRQFERFPVERAVLPQDRETGLATPLP